MLQIRNLCVSYDSTVILQNITFSVDVGDIVALTGANGSGKTTLLKCIAGFLIHDQGAIALRRDAKTAYLPQEPLKTSCTVMQILTTNQTSSEISEVDDIRKYAMVDRGRSFHINEKTAGLLNAFDLSYDFLEKKIEECSLGEQRLVNILALLGDNANLLLLDEPTNHLDIFRIQRLEEIISSEAEAGRAFLIVSHDRVFLDRLADRTLHIQRGKGLCIQGGYTALIDHLRCDTEARIVRARELSQQIARLEAEVRRKSVWAGRKEKEKSGAADKGFIGARAARLAKRGKCAQMRREKTIQKLEAEKPWIEQPWTPSFPKYRIDNRGLFRAENIGIRFAGKTIWKNLSLSARTTDHIAVTGPNGCGKTTLLRCLSGAIKPDEGNVVINHTVNVFFLHQNIGSFYDHPRFVDNFPASDIDMNNLYRLLGAAGLSHEKAGRSITELSPGELMRGALVKAIVSNCEFLILDEPTNHLDIESLEVIDDLLAEFPGGILFVSHDRRFIARHAQILYFLNESGLSLL